MSFVNWHSKKKLLQFPDKSQEIGIVDGSSQE